MDQRTVSEHEEGEQEQEREYDMESIFYEDRDDINNDHSQLIYDQTASVVPDDCSQQYYDDEEQQYGNEEGSQHQD